MKLRADPGDGTDLARFDVTLLEPSDGLLVTCSVISLIASVADAATREKYPELGHFKAPTLHPR